MSSGTKGTGRGVGAVLKKYWGFDTLRPLQAEAIDAALSGRDSLVVLPTGGGKSLCYQIPPIITGRLAVVVSPLISLMNDQVAGLTLAGYPAAALHGNLSAEQASEVRRRARAGELKLLFTAPERLLSESFLCWLTGLNVGSFAIDEAHCISQWGHDFRPEYRRLAELREVFPGVPLHAFTATATPRVRRDIVDQLALHDPSVLIGNFDRPNLTYRVVPRVRAADQTYDIVRRHAGQASIIYCLSRKDTEAMAEALTKRGLDARAYHAGLDARVRTRVAEDFKLERTDVICATVAFGMGIDRGDVRCVVHASLPASIESYQQETGRAGRDGMPAECVLLYSPGDVVRRKRLLELSRDNADDPVPPEVFEAQVALLQQMARVAGGARCRHKVLVEYFGQSLEGDGCGACDVCLGELARIPAELDASRKIVSCVARLKMGYGAAYIADILRGHAGDKAATRGHTTLSTFGLLRECSKETLVSCIDQLTDSGALIRSSDQYATVTLGPSATLVLKQELTVELFDVAGTAGEETPLQHAGGSAANSPRKRARRPAAGGGEPLSVAEADLFESMRKLRRAVADELGVPPFVVFADTVLDQLARRRPGSLEAMRSVKGVGAAKLAQFGERFLNHIRTHALNHGLALDPVPDESADMLNPPRRRA